MELTIDKFGRFVLPKKVREHLGADPGLRVAVTETPEGVLLTPVRRESGLMVKDGILIFKGGERTDPGIDWNNLVQQEREERIQELIRRSEQT